MLLLERQENEEIISYNFVELGDITNDIKISYSKSKQEFTKIKFANYKYQNQIVLYNLINILEIKDENVNIYFAGGASLVEMEILERVTSTYEPDSEIKIDLFPNPTNGLLRIDTKMTYMKSQYLLLMENNYIQ